MKKIDVDEFVTLATRELDNFAESRLSYSFSAKKNFDDWMRSFISFAGFAEEETDEYGDEEYNDEYFYSQDHQYEEYVNRRKYNSFRDDDGY